MKSLNSSKRLLLSVVVFIALASNLGAGKIADPLNFDGTLSDQGAPSASVASYGGWDLSNVDVKITDLNFDEIAGKVFNEDDGSYTVDGNTYDAMVLGDTFESDIKDANNTILVNLHGKNWPVGDPSGIKVKETAFDTVITNGKPGNCIITTSYLEDFYLDSPTPKETKCDSPFQSHKRFKLNMLPTMVEASDINTTTRYGQGVDLTFNVHNDNNTTWRYMVLQKINNYTDKRLDGYKVEIGFIGPDGNFTKASDVSADLRLSIGIGEDSTSDPVGGDIWDTDERATFSHGLFGPIDLAGDPPHFPNNGFFDDRTAGFNVEINTTTKDVFYSTTSLASNYALVPVPYATADYNTSATQFGDWLPNKWAPKGIFWDDDNDPTTDASLVAFWGDRGDGNYTWMQNNDHGFAAVTALDLAGWASSAVHEVDRIEDVLNLGINYIIEIGDITTFPTTVGDFGKFTVRITPRVAPDADQIAPGYVTHTAPLLSSYLNDAGTVQVTPAPTFTAGSALTLVVADLDLNTTSASLETVNVNVTTSLGESEIITLTEIGIDRRVFTAILPTVVGTTAGAVDGSITVTADTVVTVTYYDADNGSGAAADVKAITSATITPVIPVVSSTTSSGSGSTTDDVGLILMILGFLAIGGLIVRKRLAQ